MPAPPARRPRDAVYAPDRGCAYAPRCVTCPRAVCIKQLPAAQRAEFRAAWIVLSRSVAPADSTLLPGV